MIVSALILIGIVFGAVWLIQNIIVSDPLKREIEQQEGQSIEVLGSEVTYEVLSGSISSDGTTVQPDTIIMYTVVYHYKVANNTTDYEKSEDLEIKISDTALATKKGDNQVVFSNAPSDNNSNTVTVTVGYGKVQQEFTYQIDFSSIQTTTE